MDINFESYMKAIVEGEVYYFPSGGKGGAPKAKSSPAKPAGKNKDYIDHAVTKAHQRAMVTSKKVPKTVSWDEFRHDKKPGDSPSKLRSAMTKAKNVVKKVFGEDEDKLFSASELAYLEGKLAD